jgi:hypothetical protein
MSGFAVSGAPDETVLAECEPCQDREDAPSHTVAESGASCPPRNPGVPLLKLPLPSLSGPSVPDDTTGAAAAVTTLPAEKGGTASPNCSLMLQAMETSESAADSVPTVPVSGHNDRASELEAVSLKQRQHQHQQQRPVPRYMRPTAVAASRQRSRYVPPPSEDRSVFEDAAAGSSGARAVRNPAVTGAAASTGTVRAAGASAAVGAFAAGGATAAVAPTRRRFSPPEALARAPRHIPNQQQQPRQAQPRPPAIEDVADGVPSPPPTPHALQRRGEDRASPLPQLHSPSEVTETSVGSADRHAIIASAGAPRAPLRRVASDPPRQWREERDYYRDPDATRDYGGDWDTAWTSGPLPGYYRGGERGAGTLALHAPQLRMPSTYSATGLSGDPGGFDGRWRQQTLLPLQYYRPPFDQHPGLAAGARLGGGVYRAASSSSLLDPLGWAAPPIAHQADSWDASGAVRPGHMFFPGYNPPHSQTPPLAQAALLPVVLSTGSPMSSSGMAVSPVRFGGQIQRQGLRARPSQWHTQPHAQLLLEGRGRHLAPLRHSPVAAYPSMHAPLAVPVPPLEWPLQPPS